MSVAQVLMEDRRLRVLKTLKEISDGRMGEPVLLRVLKAEGCVTDFDTLRTDMGWLEQQGCLRVEKLPTETPHESVWVAVLTSTGSRVAEGLQRITGVAVSLAR